MGSDGSVEEWRIYPRFLVLLSWVDVLDACHCCFPRAQTPPSARPTFLPFICRTVWYHPQQPFVPSFFSAPYLTRRQNFEGSDEDLGSESDSDENDNDDGDDGDGDGDDDFEGDAQGKGRGQEGEEDTLNPGKEPSGEFSEGKGAAAPRHPDAQKVMQIS